ncbi:MAG: sigma-70 family RNA polymerase sigma factor [Deltaproteobacteria bacterium]|nr:MAG: sigma-70 family RNA polymerase sigma factor [Deltaproteobacteria bacterium]
MKEQQQERIIQETDWQVLSERLLLFCAARMRRVLWRGQEQCAVPGGVEATDIVLSAIRKFLDGQRKWPPQLTLFQFLCGVIRSEISHLATSIENRTTVRAPEEPSWMEASSEAATPFDLIARKEERLQILLRLHDDPLVCDIARLIIDQELKPAEIAEALNESVVTVYNAIKRLRRKLKSLQSSPSHSALFSSEKETLCQKI